MAALGKTSPACVAACRKKFLSLPQPTQPLQPYWPQKTYEDFSQQREISDRLTPPYNWLYVAKIDLDNGRHIYAPRRCMHCFDAPCRKICPFGAIDRCARCHKVDLKCVLAERNVGMSVHGAFRNDKPVLAFILMWLRLFAGGGVMYKCDFLR